MCFWEWTKLLFLHLCSFKSSFSKEEKENRTTIPAKTEVGLLGLSLKKRKKKVPYTQLKWTTVMTKSLATVLLTVARGFVHICIVVILQPPCVMVRTSEWSWWYQQRFRRNTNDHCHLPTQCLSDCGNQGVRPVQTTLHPLQPPTSHQISPRLSLQPLTSWKK